MGSIPIKGALPINPRAQLKPSEFQLKQKQKLRQASQMYEQKFLNTMVAQMRKTVSKSGLVKQSFTEGYFQDRLDNNYVEAWTKKGGIGLADLIYNQLEEKIFPKPHRMLKPQGPLPVAPGKAHPIKTNKVEPKFKVIESPPADGSRGVNFHIQKGSPLNDNIALTAPWGGEVTDVSSNGLINTIKISHKDELQSVISFNGTMQALNRGELLQPGQELGQLSGASSGFFWGVRLKS